MRAICGALVLALAGCNAERSARALFAGIAGREAQSCGMVPLCQDATHAIDCAEEAIRSHQPFYVGVQVHGIDSQVWHGFAQSRGAAAVWLSYDSDNSGGDIPLLRRPHLAQYPCPQPHFDRDRTGLQLRCD